jgi:hypothetical protein
MQAAMEAGITDPNEQRILKRFCCHQQVLYVSDVLDTGGKCLDKKYLYHWKPYEQWLTLIFPQEKPPNKHLHLWRQVLNAIAPRGRVQNGVGCFIIKGLKIGEWRYNKDTMKVFYLKGMVMDMYEPSLVRKYAPTAGRAQGLMSPRMIKVRSAQ